MVRIIVKRWNGQFANPGVLATIKRKIKGALANGSTALVDLDDVVLTPEQLAYIQTDFPSDKVKFCGSTVTLPHPVPVDAVLPSSSPRGEKRRSRKWADR